jgi:hypothetical protein
MLSLCECCGLGLVTEVLETHTVETLGGKRVTRVPIKYFECDTCGSTYSNPEQLTFNKNALIERK